MRKDDVIETEFVNGMYIPKVDVSQKKIKQEAYKKVCQKRMNHFDDFLTGFNLMNNYVKKLKKIL